MCVISDEGIIMNIIDELKRGLKIKSDKRQEISQNHSDDSVVQAVKCPAYVVRNRRAYVPDRVTFKKKEKA